MPTTLRILIILTTAIGSLVSSVGVGRADATARWNLLVDDYLDQILFRFNPSEGTSAGLHQYDSQLEDCSRANIDKEVAALQQFEQRVASFDASALSSTDAADHEMLLGAIHSRLLTLQIIRPWEKDPDNYSGTASNGVYVIMIRRFAPTNDRLRSAVARERQIPALLAAAHQN
ncbi:MAG: DUF885 family protein, partial [Candidatus Acidiferrales bacterium]